MKKSPHTSEVKSAKFKLKIWLAEMRVISN